MTTNNQPADTDTQEVWYCLMDSDGRDFAYELARMVLLPRRTNISQFKTAVKDHCGPVLERMSTYTIRVFKNKATFSDAFSHASELYLQVDSYVEGLGTTRSDALVVVVPSNRQKRDLESPDRFARSTWFISEVLLLQPPAILTTDAWMNIAYNGTVSNLTVEPPSDEQTKLKYFEMNFPVLTNARGYEKVFVRPCYEVLFDLILRDIINRNPSVLVTGNPGIGKSRLYAYCVMRLSKALLPTMEPLIGNELLPETKALQGRYLIIHANNLYFRFKKGTFRLLSRSRVERYQIDSNTIRLIDGHSDSLIAWRGVSILFAPPGCHQVHTFMNSDGLEYVMPPWTLKELNIAASGVTNLQRDTVITRFSLYGGIARRVLARDEPNVDSVLTPALLSGNLLRILHSGMCVDSIVKNSSHVLIHLYPVHNRGVPYSEYMLHFASHQIAEKAFDSMVAKHYSNLTEFLGKRNDDSLFMRGKLLEIYCRRFWSDPGTAEFHGRYLTADGMPFSIHVPETVETITCSKLKDILPSSFDRPFYCRPKGEPFPCIDAIYWNMESCYLLKMTVDEHGVAPAHWTKIQSWLKNVGKLECALLVFVVPENKVMGFKVQKFMKTNGQVTSSEDIPKPQCVVGIAVGPSSL